MPHRKTKNPDFLTTHRQLSSFSLANYLKQTNKKKDNQKKQTKKCAESLWFNTNFAIYYKHNVTLRLRYLFFTILKCKYFLNHRLTLNWALNLKLKANQHSPPAAAKQLKKQAKKDYKFWKPKIHNRSPKVSYFYYKKSNKILYNSLLL